MATSEGLPDDARASVEAFERATREIEAALAPFLDADRRAVTKELRPLERAEVHCEAARAIATLFGMYLRTLGVDPEKHATSKELTRVEAYARKIEETRARIGDGARGASAGARRATAASSWRAAYTGLSEVVEENSAVMDGVSGPSWPTPS